MSNPKQPDFFKHISNYILIFIFLSLWTSSQSFKYKRILQIYAVLALLSLVILFSLAQYSRQLYTFTTISNTVANSLFTLITGVHLIIVYEAFARSKAQKQLIEIFSHVDKLFQTKLKTRIDYCWEKRDLVKINLSLLTVVIPIYVTYVAYFCYLDVHSFMYHTSYSSLMIRFRTIQALFFVYLLRNRLNVINSQLKCMSNVAHGMGRTTKQTIEGKIIILKQIYEKLCDICELINSVFECSLLGIVTQNFVDFTSSCYWAFLARNNPIKCSMFLGMSIPNLTALGVFCFYCTSCYKEVNSIQINSNFMK